MKKKISITAFVLTAVILTALMPQKGIFKYKYRSGEQWAYPTLTASFDFPMLKSPREYRSDLSELQKNFTPIYRTDSVAVAKALANLASDLGGERSTTADSALLQTLSTALNDFYRTGVVAISENGARPDSGYIRIIDGNTIRTVPLDNLYTENRMREKITVLLQTDTSNRNLHPGRYVYPSLVYDRDLSEHDLRQQRERLSSTKGFISKGTVLVSSGQFVDEHTFSLLESYKTAYLNKGGRVSNLLTVIGNFLYVSIILTLSYIFLFYFRKEFSKSFGNILFLLFLYISMAGLTRLVSEVNFLSVYMIPYAIVPFFIVTFYDLRMSIFEYVSVLMLCAVITPFPFEMFFVNLFAGLAGVFISKNSYLRGKLILAAAVILAGYIVSYSAISAMQENSLADIRWGTIVWFVINAILLLTLYQLIYLFEKVFGFVTNITLFELCDTNQPLLKELAEKAPGTFQHSMQVANLAEAAAKEIGANPLFARTGALYHDIGKTCNPMYFIENIAGSYSPHKELAPEVSAEIIKKHVTDGAQLARKHNLPAVITDFISSHHGTSKIYYFYHNYIKKHGSAPEDSAFCYPGPLPVSKEATICMMADAVEAASRSMGSYTEPEIQAMIDKIIKIQIDEGQFADSLLSFNEITAIKKVFLQKISNIYHTRITYPERVATEGSRRDG